MNPMPMDIANIISVLTGVLVLGACVLLWLRSKTMWVLLALGGEAISVLCRLLVFVPDLYTQIPAIRLVWPLAALLFAIGLIGYAWTEYEASQGGAKS
jgi:hypothetical protein